MNVISLLMPKTQVAYLCEDDSIRQGLEKMRNHGYTAIPVLSKDGHYRGTVSEGDFLWHILDKQNNSLKEQETMSIKEVLRENFNPAVKIGVTMKELLERAMQQNFVPVVDDREFFIGIVTRQSIIRNLTTMRAD
ncbi:MAG: CBS domain-containing protein [Lachnospiraceae bacterium]